MPIIPNKISFIWIGKLPPFHYLKNLFDWAYQNPEYEVHIWTEQILLDLFTKEVIKAFEEHPIVQTEWEAQIIESDRGHIINFVRGSLPLARVYMNLVSTLEALCDPTILVEEWEAWKNYGSASDILKPWVAYAIGGIVWDFDTYPTDKRIPININAPHGILFVRDPSFSFTCLVSALHVSTRGNPKLRSLALFMQDNYLAFYKELKVTRGIKGSGIYKVDSMRDKNLARTLRARKQLAEIEAAPTPNRARAAFMKQVLFDSFFWDTLENTGPACIRNWIRNEEFHRWQFASEQSPNTLVNYREHELNKEIFQEYDFNFHANYTPRIESHMSWVK